MNRTRVFLLGLIAALVTSGCVTGTTLDAAKDKATYRSKYSQGVIVGSEVDTLEKGRPGYYALVPLAVAADVALMPVYLLGTVAINLGVLPPP